MPSEKKSKNTLAQRREFLVDAAKISAIGPFAGWLPLARISAAQAASYNVPPNFPSEINLYQQTFKNWAGDIRVDDVWTCSPHHADDVIVIANWAMSNGYTLRARGMMHTWSPMTLSQGQICPTVVLLDTTQFLTSASINLSGATPTVTAQTGILMDDLLILLENSGVNMTHHPAVGDITLGGVLAIDGHGTAIPAIGEITQNGASYGTVSNLILALSAVVYDSSSRRYALKKFVRSDPDISAFMVHLGRAFIIDVTLQLTQNQHLRCQSYVNIPATELFAPAGSSGRTISSFLDSTGRMEFFWFAFTDKPWLKTWKLAPSYNFPTRAVTKPYNYPFYDNIHSPLSTLASDIINLGHGYLTPAFGQGIYDAVVIGLLATNSSDIWGWSKNVLLYEGLAELHKPVELTAA